MSTVATTATTYVSRKAGFSSCSLLLPRNRQLSKRCILRGSTSVLRGSSNRNNNSSTCHFRTRQRPLSIVGSSSSSLRFLSSRPFGGVVVFPSFRMPNSMLSDHNDHNTTNTRQYRSHSVTCRWQEQQMLFPKFFHSTAVVKKKKKKKTDSSSEESKATAPTEAAAESVQPSEAKSEEGVSPAAATAADDDDDSEDSGDNKSEAAAAAAEKPTNTDDGEQQQKTVEYSTEELTRDAAAHKAGLNDPDRPSWQNPLHHNNPDMMKQFPEDFDSQEEFEQAIIPAPPLSAADGDGNDKVAAPEYLHELADEIVHLTLLEMNELVNKIADHYGFHEGILSPDDGDVDEAGTAADATGDDGDDSGETGDAAAKTAFDVKLVSYDAKSKIKVIKEVRSIVSGLGLKEAKELVEGAPCVVQKDINSEDAEEVKAKLEALGATVEIV